MNSDVRYKVYLVDDDYCTTEARRFGVDKSAASNYSYLREKIQFLFPGLRSSFTINWKDSDDDYIGIHSNEELAIALNECPQQPILLYVKVQKEDHRHHHHHGKIKTQSLKHMTHPQIVCDGCNKPIAGFRYKCLQCLDFDLCSRCEHKKLHYHHCMIRIPYPIKWSSESGHQLIQDMFSFLQRYQRNFVECHMPENNGDISYWVDAFNKFYSQCPFNKSKETKKEETDEKTSSSDKKTKQEEATKSNGPGTDFFTDTLAPGIEYFLNIIMAAEGGTEKCPVQKPTAPEEDISKKFPGEGKKLVDDKQDDKQDDKGAMSDSSTELLSNHEESPTKATIAEDWTIVDKNETSSISHASSVSSALNETAEKLVPSTTTLEPSAPSAPSAQSAPSVPTPSTVPVQSIPTATETKPSEAGVDSTPIEKVYHPNPKIQNALEAMMSMGFPNRTGLLTYLLEAEDGNINKVLDLLQREDP